MCWWSQPINNWCCGWTVLVVIIIARCSWGITIRKLWRKKKKKGLLLKGPGNYVADLGPHSEVWIKRESAGARSSFIWGQGWEPRVLQARSLLVNLKHNSRNLKHGKRKNKWPKWSVIEISQDLRNKGALVEGGRLVFLLVLWLAICLLKIDSLLWSGCLSKV